MFPSRNTKINLWALMLTALVAQFSLPAQASPSAEVWEQWAKQDPQSTMAIDHSDWDRFLNKYVTANKDGVNRVTYDKVTQPDHKLLETYIKQLAGTNISKYKREEQRAYWINLYNALTLREILNNYPLGSIKEIKSNFFTAGPWKKTLVTVEQTELSLDDIEHRILRPIWKDPRTHYAVNCASIGCPNLLPTAFTAENINALLDSGARDYINNSRGAQVINGKLRVSSIYFWFQEDFGGSEIAVIKHLKEFANLELRAQLENITRIDADTYNWSLNDQKVVKNKNRRGT